LHHFAPHFGDAVAVFEEADPAFAEIIQRRQAVIEFAIFVVVAGKVFGIEVFEDAVFFGEKGGVKIVAQAGREVLRDLYGGVSSLWCYW